MRIVELLNEEVMTVNKKLNPVLWEGGSLKSEIREKLVEIAKVFQEFIGVELDVADYTLTGSNANFTWTEYSDLDLHIIVRGMPSDEQRELYNAKKALWAEEHNIRIKNLPVECYVQGAKEPHHSTGVYSLSGNKWLVEPKKVKPNINDAAVSAKKDSIQHDIEAALISKDLPKMRIAKQKLTKMRKAGLERAGEFSVENIVFKQLRNLGMIDQLSDEIRDLEDAQLSLEQAPELV